MSGLDIALLPSEVKEALEADLVAVNRVLAKYKLERDDDYRPMSDADLQHILDILDGLAWRVLAEDEEERNAALHDIIFTLDTCGHKLPVEAVREARAHRDLIVPKLIEVLREASAEAREGRQPEGDAHWLGLYLLTEFRAKEALPAILEAVSLPGELPFDLFGDSITEELASILVSLADDPLGVLESLVRNRELNEYVRWEGAQGFLYLVRDGRLSREEAVRRLQQHLREAVEQGDLNFVTDLVTELASYSPKEAYDDIKEAYDRGLVDSSMIAVEDIERSIAEGEFRLREEIRRLDAKRIDDVLEVWAKWPYFREKPAGPPAAAPPVLPPPPSGPPRSNAAQASLDFGPMDFPPMRAGRNDPCPCGSGKKFKKCCGAHK
jgi:hypothetical protein